MVIQGTGAQQKIVSIHPYGALVGAGSLFKKVITIIYA